jgi:nucleoside-diphosphate-sugar epimerase
VDESCFWQADEKHNEYAKSKFRAEMEVERAVMEGLKTFVVNPSFVIGPGSGSRSSGAVFTKVKNGLPFYTSGSTGYVHAGDVAEAMVLLMESDIENEHFILNSENRDLKSFFNAIANGFNVKAPEIKAGKLLLDIAWRMDYLKFKLTGIEPVLTKSSVRIAQTKFSYSSKKFIDATGFNFRTLDEAIADTVAFMKKYKH